MACEGLHRKLGALKVESWAIVPGDANAAKDNDNEPTADRADPGVPRSLRLAPWSAGARPKGSASSRHTVWRFLYRDHVGGRLPRAVLERA